MLSRVLGFLRDMLLAHLLGPAADAFLVAFRLPNFFRRLLAEGSLGLAHAAAMAKTAATDGREAALALHEETMAALFRLCLPLTLIGILAAGPLVFLMAPGFAGTPALMDEAVFLTRCCLPYLPLAVLAATALAARTGLGLFSPQAASPVLFNLVVIGAGLTALWLHLPPSSARAALASGIVLAGAAQLAAPLASPFALAPMRNGRSNTRDRLKKLFSLGIAFPRPEVRRILLQTPLLALGAAPHQLQVILGAILASFLAQGSISALYFAERLAELPLGLAGVAVGIAALPRLAAMAAHREYDAMARSLSDSLCLTAFLSLPAAAGLLGLSLPLVRLLFGHGAFGDAEATLTASCLSAYALGLPAMCASRPLLSAAAALNMTRTPLHAGLASLAVLLAVSLPAMAFMGSTGIALGVSAAAWVNAAWLLKALRARGIRCPDNQSVKRIVYYAAMAGVLWAGLGLASFPEGGRAGLAASILGITFGAAALWIGLLYAAKSPEARALASLLRKDRS